MRQRKTLAVKADYDTHFHHEDISLSDEIKKYLKAPPLLSGYIERETQDSSEAEGSVKSRWWSQLKGPFLMQWEDSDRTEDSRGAAMAAKAKKEEKERLAVRSIKIEVSQTDPHVEYEVSFLQTATGKKICSKKHRYNGFRALRNLMKPEMDKLREKYSTLVPAPGPFPEFPETSGATKLRTKMGKVGFGLKENEIETRKKSLEAWLIAILKIKPHLDCKAAFDELIGSPDPEPVVKKPTSAPFSVGDRVEVRSSREDETQSAWRPGTVESIETLEEDPWFWPKVRKDGFSRAWFWEDWRHPQSGAKGGLSEVRSVSEGARKARYDLMRDKIDSIAEHEVDLEKLLLEDSINFRIVGDDDGKRPFRIGTKIEKRSSNGDSQWKIFGIVHRVHMNFHNSVWETSMPDETIDLRLMNYSERSSVGAIECLEFYSFTNNVIRIALISDVTDAMPTWETMSQNVIHVSTVCIFSFD